MHILIIHIVTGLYGNVFRWHSIVTCSFTAFGGSYVPDICKVTDQMRACVSSVYIIRFSAPSYDCIHMHLEYTPTDHTTTYTDLVYTGTRSIHMPIDVIELAGYWCTMLLLIKKLNISTIVGPTDTEEP